jgi:hypothetical protein
MPSKEDKSTTDPKYKSTLYSFEKVSWAPIVKNWFNKDAINRSNYEVLIQNKNGDKGKDDPEGFVPYSSQASINVNIEACIEDILSQHYLVLNVSAQFESAGYNGVDSNPTSHRCFVEPYQDIVGLEIAVKGPVTLGPIKDRRSYECNLDSSANENAEHHIKATDSHMSMDTHADMKHVGGGNGGLHGGHTKVEFSSTDMNKTSKACPTTNDGSIVSHTVKMTSCYNENRQPAVYDCSKPYESMRVPRFSLLGWFDFNLRQPPELAKGGLLILPRFCRHTYATSLH